MKISELPTWNNTIPMGTYAVISVPVDGGTFKNYKLDMSSLTVSGGGGGTGGGGLTEEDVEKVVEVFNTHWDNEDSKLANLLAMYTGMRAGEVQAVQLKDIHDNYIWVSHSYNKYNELVPTKNGECRPCPISKDLHDAMITRAKSNPLYSILKDETFVFYGQDPSKPMNQRVFNTHLKKALKQVGFKNPEAIGFHCWRHGFCTGAAGIISDNRLIRVVSGHKTQQMFEHYSKHVEQQKTIEIMGKAAEQLFGDIVSNTLKTATQEEIAV